MQIKFLFCAILLLGLLGSSVVVADSACVTGMDVLLFRKEKYYPKIRDSILIHRFENQNAIIIFG